MKFKLPSQEEAEVQMAPMIDMVFLLLIFFMVASTVTELEKVDVNIPVAENTKVPEDTTGRLMLSIDGKGVIYTGTRPVQLDQLGALLAKELEKDPNLKVYLRADAALPFREIRQVMKTCAENGAADLIFATFQSE